MPLKSGKGAGVRAQNIHELMSTGKYPIKQATAIAYSKQREGKKKKKS